MLESKPFTNEFSWSVSSDKVFAECKRKYYYNRYGSWDGWLNKSGEKTKELYLLKKLTPKDLWVGSRVHETVKTVLERVRDGKAISLMEAEKFLEQKMKNDYNDSKQNLFRREPKVYTRFFEHEYGLEFGVSEAIDSIEFARKCLKNFFESETYAQLKNTRKSDWLTIDEQKPTSFQFEGTKVYVKLDAAVRSGERIAIFDWKTGRKEDVDYTAQLACYLLYATRVWNAQPNKIDVFEVNLAQNYSKKHAGLSAKIDWIENYMRNSIAGIKKLLKDADANAAEEEAFPQVDELRKCSRCVFLRACKPPVLPEGNIEQEQ